jgi:hypothetical protein
MNEFNNRIDAQREILKLVNLKTWPQEELCGLSKKAIDRWILVNVLDPRCRLVELVRTAADQLFFLANRSQEQVTDEYKLRSRKVGLLMTEIGEQMRIVTAA